MNKALGIGVVGCGSVFSAYLPIMEQLVYHGRARLALACDARPQMETVVKEQHGFAAFTSDYRRLVNAADVDIVVILTSMLEHAPIARAALEAGKHVLVEKPLATTLEEAAALVELAKSSAGYLAPAPFVTLSPTYQAIGRHIRAGDIGRPLSARARYGWSGPWWSKWFYRQGGGAIFDLAPYNITSLTGLLGPVQRVIAMTGTAIPERLVDGVPVRVNSEDNAHILLDFGAATFAVVTTGFTLQQYRCPPLEVYGSQGVIQMLGDDWDPEGYELWQNSAGAWQVYKETDPNWSWCDGLNHLIDCIEKGNPPSVTPEHAYHVLEIMIRAKESGRDGVARRVESTFTPPLFNAKTDEIQAHLLHDRTHKLEH